MNRRHCVGVDVTFEHTGLTALLFQLQWNRLNCVGGAPLGLALWSSSPSFVPLIGSLPFLRFGVFVSKVPLHGFEIVICMAVAALRFEEFNESGGYASVCDAAFLCCLPIRRQ